MKNNKLNLKFIAGKSLGLLKPYNSFLNTYPILFYRCYISNQCKNNNDNINCNNNNNSNNGNISFIDYFWSGIVCLLFLFVSYFMFESYFVFIISFYISILVSLYVFDNYKYSSIYIIRLNQKCVISIIIIILSIMFFYIIMDYFDIINHILCEGSDNVDVSSSNSDISNN
jgi:hypothetical protein